jgi:phage protein D
MHPICQISINGVPVSGAFLQALISCTVTDKEGGEGGADTIDLELEAGPGLVLPLSSAIITCFMGYRETGVSFMGAFTADDATLECLPYKIKIQGKSADMREGIKEHKSRHWDGETFGGVVQKMAGEVGLTARVSEKLASYKGKDGYFHQGNESNAHWIERMSRKLGGIMSVKDGNLVVAERGAGLSVSGLALGGIIVTPGMIIEGTCSTTFAQRPQHGDVEAGRHDKKSGERKWEKAPGVEGGSAKYRLRGNHDDQDTAQRAAESRGKDLRRSAVQTQVGIEGNIAARGGSPMSYAGVHPEIDAVPFIIDTATHKFLKRGGYTTQISAKAQA